MRADSCEPEKDIPASRNEGQCYRANRKSARKLSLNHVFTWGRTAGPLGGEQAQTQSLIFPAVAVFPARGH